MKPCLGDKYFVCWDPDLVPARVSEVCMLITYEHLFGSDASAQSYDYPPNKEHVSKKVTREDLANYFAAYNKRVNCSLDSQGDTELTQRF